MPSFTAQAMALDEANEAPVPIRASVLIQECVSRDYAIVWRFLRRPGVPVADVDDATHIVSARTLAKGDCIEPQCARAYFMKTAYHLSFEYRRTAQRQRLRASEVDVEQLIDANLAPDDGLQRRHDRKWLDTSLDQLPTELRAVFTLFELEGMTFT